MPRLSMRQQRYRQMKAQLPAMRPTSWTPWGARSTPGWDVCGTGRTDRAYFVLALGQNAFNVWLHLVKLRDDAGMKVTRCTTDATAERLGMEAHHYQYALKVLAKYGLQRLVCVRWERVPGVAEPVRVYYREVLGARLSEKADWLLVPTQALALMKTRAKWGGDTQAHAQKRRAGRGQDCPQLGAFLPAYLIPEYPKGSVSLRETERAAPAAPLLPLLAASPQLPPTTQAPATPAPQEDTMPPAHTQDPPFQPPGAPELGSKLGGGVAPATPAVAWQLAGVVPPYPGASVLAAPTLPTPPNLDPAASEMDRVWLLVKAYRGAVEARYGKRCWVYGRGITTKSPGYRALAAAAQELTEREFPPAAWVLFSLDAWERVQKKRASKPKHFKSYKPPPIAWVFSATRIQNREGWFRAEEGGYCGGRAIFTDAHKELLARYQRMQRALLQERPATPAQVQALVARYFQPGEYDQLLAAAKAEAERTKAKLREMADRGDFLWDER